MDVGPCDGAFPRWYFNAKSGECEMFSYGGCGGNENNFETKEACAKECICKLPAVTGPCDGAIPRWYFNTEAGNCEEFIYGGCGGNPNNFGTKKECLAECGIDICTLPVKPGPCKGSFPRWYFNSETGTCEMFIYGGCEGNENNFETKEACAKECGDGDICQLSAEAGPCKAYKPRWFFNSKTGDCEEFVYGGCDGNENNFATKADCLEKCGDGDVCELFPDTGPCEASIPRWYFNFQSGECEMFDYGGCEGNENNFETEKECLAECGKT
jgi:hypothetical protein